MSKPHRISLKANWKVNGSFEPGEKNRMEFVAIRSFHSPTGISEAQELRFCFVPTSAEIIFVLNGVVKHWTLIEGLATACITVMIGSINRVELRWRGEALETPRLPEHFAAWLDILQET